MGEKVRAKCNKFVVLPILQIPLILLKITTQKILLSLAVVPFGSKPHSSQLAQFWYRINQWEFAIYFTRRIPEFCFSKQQGFLVVLKSTLICLYIKAYAFSHSFSLYLQIFAISKNRNLKTKSKTQQLFFFPQVIITESIRDVT